MNATKPYVPVYVTHANGAKTYVPRHSIGEFKDGDEVRLVHPQKIHEKSPPLHRRAVKKGYTGKILGFHPVKDSALIKFRGVNAHISTRVCDIEKV